MPTMRYHNFSIFCSLNKLITYYMAGTAALGAKVTTMN